MKGFFGRMAAVLVTAGAVLAVTASTGQAVTITEYTSGLNGYSEPGFIVDGPDGNMWFTDSNCGSSHPTCALGRITPSGAITEYGGGTLQSGAIPDDITLGPDGNLWFTVQSPAAIGRITPAGAITEYTGPALPSASQPQGIALGPDGNLWVAVQNQNLDVPGTQGEIARVTPAGAITAFTSGLNKNTEPQFIADGPGGDLWFTDSDEDNGTAAAIGKVTASGEITESATGLSDGDEPERLGPGPNGSLWFIDDYFHFLGQISAAGQVSDAPLSQGDSPTALAVAPDGSVWFTDCGQPPAIGRISPSGQTTYYTAGLPDASCPDDIIEGPDGNMWFTDSNGHGVGKVTLGLAPVVSTGKASDITRSQATVGATVNPAGGAVSSIVFQYGRTTAYGSSATATPGSLPSGGQPVAVSARLTGLPSQTLFHYRVVATNAYGTTYGADQTFGTTSASGCPYGAPCPFAPAKPVLGRVRQSHVRWRETGEAHKHAPPLGTTFRFTLNAPASVRLRFAVRARGRKVHGACVAPTKHNTRDRTCTRSVSRGSFRVVGGLGTNKVAFHGRVGSHVLKPGSYTVAITASNSAGHTATHRLSFTIVK